MAQPAYKVIFEEDVLGLKFVVGCEQARVTSVVQRTALRKGLVKRDTLLKIVRPDKMSRQVVLDWHSKVRAGQRVLLFPMGPMDGFGAVGSVYCLDNDEVEHSPKLYGLAHGDRPFVLGAAVVAVWLYGVHFYSPTVMRTGQFLFDLAATLLVSFGLYYIGREHLWLSAGRRVDFLKDLVEQVRADLKAGTLSLQL